MMATKLDGRRHAVGKRCRSDNLEEARSGQTAWRKGGQVGAQVLASACRCHRNGRMTEIAMHESNEARVCLAEGPLLGAEP
jgi:hypothetical protein